MSAHKGEAHHRERDHERPVSPGQTRSPSDIQQKLKEFRRKDVLWIIKFAAILLAVVAGFSVLFWIDIQQRALTEKQLLPPANWDEAQYLSKNPDVAAAVRRGRFKSGWRHYVIIGVEEGRQGVSIEE